MASLREDMQAVIDERGGNRPFLTVLYDRAAAGELRAVQMILTLLGEDFLDDEVKVTLGDGVVEIAG